MAKIELSYVLSDLRCRVGNTVFSKSGITNYIREYRKQDRPQTASHLAAMHAFSTVGTTWEFLPPALKSSWRSEMKTKGLNPYARFMKVNATKLHSGEPMVLTERINELPLETLACAPGATGEIVCTFTFPHGVTGKNVVFFIQKMEGDGPVGHPRVMEAGMGVTSPFTLTGLETGVDYTVHGVVTDGLLVDAKGVSVSQAARGLAG